MGRTIHPLPMSHPRRIGARGFGRGRSWGWMCGANVRGGVAFAPLSLVLLGPIRTVPAILVVVPLVSQPFY